MRQKRVGADHNSAAHQDAVRAGAPAGRTTSLPPHAAPVTAVPPAAVTGVVSSPPARPARDSRLRRWLSGHAQLVIIAGLVALASLATAALVTTGARQLNSAPAQTTTPYIAAQPNGPVHAPDVSATPGSGAAAASRDAAAKSEKPGSGAPRGRPEARTAKPTLPRAPERTTERAPGTPELGTPPPKRQPPSVERPRLPRECRANVRALHRCVARMPQPPQPPAFPSPPWR